MNTLYYGDNLDILPRYVTDESVDLVYLDPPFNSSATYNVLFAERNGSQSASQIRAFEDTWHWDQSAAKAHDRLVEAGGQVSLAMQAFRTVLGENDMLAYLSMMAPRLVELRRVLKPTGSIYLHCDPTASHYLKLLMDAVFGPACFLNEIVWKRTSAHSSAQRYGPVHDILLFYGKSSEYVWNRLYQPYDEDYLETFFDNEDSDGRKWKRMDLTGAGVRHGETGNPWHGIDITAKGRHWAYPPSVLDRMESEGKIHFPKAEGGMPRLKQYADEMSGVPLQDTWMDIHPLHNLAAERLGYPTQKPEALLERIIQTSSNQGDVVLDPFCGCGTAVAAAQKLNRQWIGIDITALAVSLIKNRLTTAFGSKIREKYSIIGEPQSLTDAAMLAAEDPYQFQWWALGLVGARPTEQKKGADKGIDGRIFFHDDVAHKQTKQIIISVKAGTVHANHVSELHGVVDREKAAIGVLITQHPPTKPMRSQAASAGFYESSWGLGMSTKHPRIQILTVEELLNGKTIDMPPRQDDRTYKRAPKAKPVVSDKPEQKRLID